MILCTGIALIQVDWIQNRLEQHPELRNLLFHPEEIDYCAHYRFSSTHYAGRYASKQAVQQSLGIPIDENNFKEILISRTSYGQPTVEFLGKLSEKKICFSLSISHSRRHAIAFVVAEK